MGQRKGDFQKFRGWTKSDRGYAKLKLTATDRRTEAPLASHEAPGYAPLGVEGSRGLPK